MIQRALWGVTLCKRLKNVVDSLHSVASQHLGRSQLVLKVSLPNRVRQPQERAFIQITHAHGLKHSDS